MPEPLDGLLASRVPQDEHELVAMLHPEDPMLFAQARRLLGQSVRGGADRLGVGDVVRDGWSVLRGRNGWVAARHEGGVHRETVVFDDPRSAVVCAVAGVMAAAGLGVNSGVLQAAGILEIRPEISNRRVLWVLTERGREIRERTSRSPRPPADVAAGRSYISLDPLDGRPRVYFVCPVGPPPAEGSFLSTHEVFERLVRTLLPEPVQRPGTADDGSLVLPEGTGSTPTAAPTRSWCTRRERRSACAGTGARPSITLITSIGCSVLCGSIRVSGSRRAPSRPSRRASTRRRARAWASTWSTRSPIW